MGSLSRGLLDIWKRFERRPLRIGAGQSMVELALILPFLCVLFIGVLDLGRAFHTEVALSNAARVGLLYAQQVVPRDSSGTSRAYITVRDVITQTVAEAQGGISLTPANVTVCLASGTTSVCPVVDTTQPIAANEAITIAVTVPFTPITPLIHLRTISGSVRGRTFTFDPLITTGLVTPGPATSTATPAPTSTSTPVPPTATSTPIPPTATSTPIPPTATSLSTLGPGMPTWTPAPPTSTPTTVPSTNTPTTVPSTNTPTTVPPTNTATPQPAPTISNLTCVRDNSQPCDSSNKSISATISWSTNEYNATNTIYYRVQGTATWYSKRATGGTSPSFPFYSSGYAPTGTSGNYQITGGMVYDYYVESSSTAPLTTTLDNGGSYYSFNLKK